MSKRAAHDLYRKENYCAAVATWKSENLHRLTWTCFKERLFYFWKQFERRRTGLKYALPEVDLVEFPQFRLLRMLIF